MLIGQMNETITEAESNVFVPKVNPLQKIVQQVNSTIIDPSDQENTAFNHQGYFNGAFVDLLQQSKYAQSLKSKDYNKDWHHHKSSDDFEWSSDQINTLLEFYAEYPQLWDTKHEKYMNKDIRKQLISQLSEKIGAPEHAVNVKFQRLRVHFSRELRKEESSIHEVHPYQSKWKYYNKMLFLKDTLKCRQKIRQSNNEREQLDMASIVSGSGSSSSSSSNPAIPITAHSYSDSGHSSPDSETVSPTVVSSGQHQTPPTPQDTRSPQQVQQQQQHHAPLSPSLISAPFSSVSSTLVPPLLRNNNLFPNPLPPTPPAFLSSLEHLLSPNVLGPMMMTTGKKEAGSPSISSILKPSKSLLAPTPQVPTSPLTPNVVCSVPSFWNSPHVLTSSKLLNNTVEDDDAGAARAYQSKRQKIKLETDRTREKVCAGVEERFRAPAGDIVTDCDYFSMHVSEALRKMDIVVREECKRAIQNTICHYIVKSCSKDSLFTTPHPLLHSAGLTGMLSGAGLPHPSPRLPGNRKP